MADINLKGMGVALITPFKEDESVDYEALGKLVDYQVQNGTDYLVVLGTTAETPTLTEEEKKNRDLKAKLLEINKIAATYYYHQLKAENGKIGLSYLQKRGLSDTTINRFGLGYAGQTGNALYQYLKSKGYDDALLKETGLFTYERGIHDKFWNRVMFPIMDINNKVIGFGGRVMGDAKPKYLNSPETKLFDKSRNLYGLNAARISRKSNMIICEGYM